MKTFKVLFIGDIFAQVGRHLIVNHLSKIVSIHNVHFVVANAENATHGRSLSKKHYQMLQKVGIDVFTMGNHAFALTECQQLLDEVSNVLRPANYSILAPGRGSAVFLVHDLKIRITNLVGRTFMDGKGDNPFLHLENIVEDDDSDFHFVDFHAESTAEKIALAWAFDGRITGLLGTHTHVPTADLRILPKNTFFISDIGMTGPYNSIIGANPENIIKSQQTGLPFRLVPATGDGQICAVLLELDVENKKVQNFQQIYEIIRKSN